VALPRLPSATRSSYNGSRLVTTRAAKEETQLATTSDVAQKIEGPSTDPAVIYQRLWRVGLALTEVYGLRTQNGVGHTPRAWLLARRPRLRAATAFLQHCAIVRPVT
jgi:hypothetical protein